MARLGRNYTNRHTLIIKRPRVFAVNLQSITPSGEVTPVGVVAEKLVRILTGTMTSSGTITTRFGRIVTGEEQPTGVIAQRIARIITGGETPSGELVENVVRILSGEVTSSATLLQQLSRLLDGASTPAGALAMSNVLGPSGSETPAGALKKTIYDHNEGFTITQGDFTPTRVEPTVFGSHKWFFYDGFSLYNLPMNPRAGGSPSYRKNIHRQQPTNPAQGFVIRQEGRSEAPTGSIEGTLNQLVHYRILLDWWNNKPVIQIRDDLGRFYKLAPTDLQIQHKPLRNSPWRHTYSMNYVLLDPVGI